MNKVVSLIFILLLLSPISGELWRLPVFGFDLLPSDILIPIFLLVWLVDKLKNDRMIRIGKIGKAIIFFLFILLITYLINLFRFDLHEMIVAGAYMARFVMYILLTFVTFDLLERDKSQFAIRVVIGSMIISMILISLFGFLQLKYFSSFLELGMELKGWDPHIGRLLSTWFDPNFIGGFLAFILGPVIALGLYFWKQKNKKYIFLFLIISIIGLIALYLTFSRSGYLAAIATLGIIALFKSRRLLVAIILISVLAFTFSPRVQERVTNAWDSGKALIGLDSQKPLDPTARLRVDSWRYAREIITDHPWIGIGYSRYKYEINHRGHGLLSDHASGGSDSSLLTIWATTGIFGLISYLAIYFAAITLAIRRIIKKVDFQSYLNTGLIASLGGVLIHSIFVNSLLFPLTMVYLWVGMGILDNK